jgi:hypothetical protein
VQRSTRRQMAQALIVIGFAAAVAVIAVAVAATH